MAVDGSCTLIGFVSSALEKEENVIEYSGVPLVYKDTPEMRTAMPIRTLCMPPATQRSVQN